MIGAQRLKIGKASFFWCNSANQNVYAYPW